jgi:hypothetical protein
MTRNCRLFLLVAMLLPLLSCYYDRSPNRITADELRKGTGIKVPSKIHLTNGSVLVCLKGFDFRDNVIYASGEGFNFSGDRLGERRWMVPVDSVAAMEYFEQNVQGARVGASILLGAVVGSEIAVGSIALLKAIFGSCPTVYSLHDGSERLEAECFSYSIAKTFEMTDYDRLGPQELKNGRVVLRLKNEALETHYIDRFTLCYADHPAGTELFPADNGDVVAAGHLMEPLSAVNSQGKDVLPLISSRDGSTYSIDSASASEMLSARKRDWITCRVPVSKSSDGITVAIRARNSLENTVLLYDVMMRNQGLNVLEWTRDLNTSSLDALELAGWYRDNAGIDIQVFRGGEFVSAGKIFDTGPIAWKLAAERVPAEPGVDTLLVRLEFLPDNWDIDWIGFDPEYTTPPPVKEAVCVSCTSNNDRSQEDAAVRIGYADGSYFVTYPGESYDLTFDPGAAPADPGMERTYFVRSTGYYIEWVRPEWVKIRPDIPGFNVTDRDQITRRLSELWLTKKGRFEDEFYHNRIPVAQAGERQ